MRFLRIIWHLLSWALLVTCDGYYSVIAPGLIKSNRKYTVLVSLHDAQAASTIRISIEGPLYQSTKLVSVQPSQTLSLDFFPPKLMWANYKLLAEGVDGIQFRNESKLFVHHDAGPRIYIQTDRAVYKPEGVIQFRVVILDEHMRPMRIREPIRVEILDGQRNRVKQFKDIPLIHGVFSGLVHLSKYPVLGHWHIRVAISGKYNYSQSKTVIVQNNHLPKFNVHIETNANFVVQDRVLRLVVYGKYISYDKYVAGNVTAQLLEPSTNTVIQELQSFTKDKALMTFTFDNVQSIQVLHGLLLQVMLTERHTGRVEKANMYISIRNQHYQIFIKTDSVKLLDDRSYRLSVKVKPWNGSAIEDRSTAAVRLQYNSITYESYLNDNDEAAFEFEGDIDGPFVFDYKDSTYTVSSIMYYARRGMSDSSDTTYCRLRLNGERPSLNKPVRIEVSCLGYIPYLVYTVMGHANIIHSDHIILPPNEKTYMIQIQPSMEMIPLAFVYIHYIENGNLRHGELRLDFPEEFENKISLLAPPHAEPGQEVTFELKAQPKSYVCILAVDRNTNMFGTSYDLKKSSIMEDLRKDISYTETHAPDFPGSLSGVITLTNAHYSFSPVSAASSIGPATSATLLPRWNLPDTWIFTNFVMSNESMNVTLNIPDTITAWRITAFSVNEVTGFGMIDGPVDITTIQQFFMELKLPHSIKRGETISILVLVHNNHEQDLHTTVTLYNRDREFYFMNSTIFDVDKGSSERKYVKYLSIQAHSVERVSFLINPRVVGNVTLYLEANNTLAAIAITRNLTVEPDSVTKFSNKALYANITSNEMLMFKLFINLPLDAVPDTATVFLSVGGNTLVPVLENINDLLRLPSVGGEQNMVKFAPSIFILEYLKSSGKYSKQRPLVNIAKRNLEIGYQQQLSYRHENGGYSTFGPDGSEGPSIWLTAYVIRYFIKASRLVAMEARSIESSLEYLSSQQLEDGSFPATGILLRNTDRNSYAITAFVLLAFMEDMKYTIRYHNLLQTGLHYLNGSIEKVNDLYTLSIMAKALQKAQYANVQTIIDKLLLHSEKFGTLMWWSENDENLEKDIEITANILLVLLDNSKTEPHVLWGIQSWLVQQRNDRGGFLSSRDTVVGLEALAKFTLKQRSRGNINITLQYAAVDWEGDIVKSGTIQMDGSNMLQLQMEQLPPFTRYVDINATGSGHYFSQLSYQYQIAAKDTKGEHFKIVTEAKMINRQQMILDICFTNAVAAITNMLIVEVNLPSGFVCVNECQYDLMEISDIERVEARKGATSIMIYLKSFAANTKRCLTTVADKMFDVIVRKPVAVVIYDYYNITSKDVSFYTI